MRAVGLLIEAAAAERIVVGWSGFGLDAGVRPGRVGWSTDGGAATSVTAS